LCASASCFEDLTNVILRSRFKPKTSAEIAFVRDTMILAQSVSIRAKVAYCGDIGVANSRPSMAMSQRPVAGCGK